MSLYHPPSDCPVCGGELITTRLGCRGCGSELAGEFGHCDFCSLNEAESELLRVFLASRGNLREVDATAIKILNAISKGGSGNGNAQLGSSPLGLLRRTVPGYGKTNELPDLGSPLTTQ